jgi:hypothetical protein
VSPLLYYRMGMSCRIRFGIPDHFRGIDADQPYFSIPSESIAVFCFTNSLDRFALGDLSDQWRCCENSACCKQPERNEDQSGVVKLLGHTH